MKKNLIFLMAIVLIGTVVSCSESINESVFEENITRNAEKFLWEHQFDYAMEHNTVVDFPLKMLSYKYIGVISNGKDVEEYLDFVFSENSYLAVNSERVDEKFEVFKRQNVIDECAKQGLDAYEQFERHRKQVSNYISIGNTHVVEISWNYYGVDFVTWALVDKGNKGFIYDNVASVARCPRPNAEVVWKKYEKKDNLELIHSTRTDDEYQGRIVKTSFHMTDNHEDRNYMGRYLWWYEMICISKFSEETGIYLGTEEMWARATFEETWCCDAKIITVIGEPMISPSHVIRWAYSYGVGTVSISIVGSGFTFNGGGVTMQGERSHTIDTCSTAG